MGKRFHDHPRAIFVQRIANVGSRAHWVSHVECNPVSEEKDFTRAEQAASLFPGAILCFCTFNETLNNHEIRGLTKLANQGRKRMDVGKQMNPVLILTGRELFSEFMMTDSYSIYGDKAEYARSMYMRDDIQELCDFMQQLYLGMPSYHEWLQETRRKRAAKLAARNPGTPTN